MTNEAQQTVIDESLRGLSEWLIRKYLAEIGAADNASAEPGHGPLMMADGWSVGWRQQRISIPGSSIRLTQFDMRFEGTPGIVEDAFERFMKKAQRGGG